MAPHPAIFGTAEHGRKIFPLSPSPFGYGFDSPSVRPSRNLSRHPPVAEEGESPYGDRNTDIGTVNNEGAPMISIEKSCSRLIIRGSLVFALFAPQFSRLGDREPLTSSRYPPHKTTWRTWRRFDKCGNRNELRFCTNLAGPISNLADLAKPATTAWAASVQNLLKLGAPHTPTRPACPSPQPVLPRGQWAADAAIFPGIPPQPDRRATGFIPVADLGVATATEGDSTKPGRHMATRAGRAGFGTPVKRRPFQPRPEKLPRPPWPIRLRVDRGLYIQFGKDWAQIPQAFFGRGFGAIRIAV